MASSARQRALGLARALQEVADELGVAEVRTAEPPPEFDSIVTEPELRTATRRLFLDGHYAQAVEEAFKLLNNVVKKRSGLALDGASLMTTAFSEKKPVLKLNALKTRSHQDQQVGYMQMMQGAMTGIRNPRAHDPHLDDPRTALELLSFANHLVRTVRTCKRARVRKPKASP